MSVDDFVSKQLTIRGSYNALTLNNKFYIGGKGVNTFGRNYTDSPNFIGCLSQVSQLFLAFFLYLIIFHGFRIQSSAVYFPSVV